MYSAVFFFFQAEDGIRDDLVTGVQTCALPISASTSQQIVGPISWKVLVVLLRRADPHCHTASSSNTGIRPCFARTSTFISIGRSEERRVGKECRSRCSGNT